MNHLDTSLLEREETFSQDFNDELASSLYRDSDTEVSQEQEDTERLVEEKDLLKSDRTIKNSKWLHLFSALVVASVFAVLGYFLFWTFGKIMTAGKQQEVEEVQISEEEQQYQSRIEELEREVDRKNAKLAFNQEDTSQWEEIQSEPQPSSQIEPQPESIEKQALPPSERSQVTTAEAREPAIPKQQLIQENIDPLEEWARLANIGTVNGENNTDINSVTLASERTESFTSPTSNSVTSRHSPPSIPDITPTTSDSKTPSLGIQEGEVAKVASVTIGSSNIKSKNTSDLDSQDSVIADLLSDAPSTNDYLEEKKRQYREEDERNRLSSLASDRKTESKQFVSAVTTIANTSINKDIPSSKSVPIGSSIKGELSTDLILSEGLEETRGIIYINEPLLTDNGATALPENSAIIVEASSVNNSGLVKLIPIAVSYQNSSGNLIQETLPKESVLIQGKKGALIADRVNGTGGSNFGQDLLLAGLGAGEKAFEIINEPERVRQSYGSRGRFDEDFEDTDFFDFDHYNYGNYSTRRSDEASLATGAAEGAFSTTKERLEDRSRQMQQEHQNELPIYRLESGTEVLIFINSFLTIEP